MYKIRKNVPIPSRMAAASNRARKKRSKYPFDAMHPGDSFVVKLNGQPVERVRSRVMNAATNWMQHNDALKSMKFASRYLANEKAVGVWRTR